MIDENVELEYDGKLYDCVVRHFESSDDNKISKLYNAWRYLSQTSKELGCRAANIPEGLSETLFCRITGAVRIISKPAGFPSSFDTFDLKRGKKQELKCTSIYNDLTSFSPLIRCDELYWIDLYRNGDWDGTLDIYPIDIESVMEVKLNKKETFRDAQLAGRRPRFSVRKEIINKQNIKPVFSGRIVTNKKGITIVGKALSKSKRYSYNKNSK
jgi:hypothetical protein